MAPRLPRVLRRRLQRLGRTGRATPATSGWKEWSDQEVARLHPRWISGFLRRHVRRCAVLVLLYLIAFAFLLASFERYWYWVSTLEATASEPVKKIDQYKAYCVVKPWTRACQPHRRDEKTAAVTSGRVALASTQGLPLGAAHTSARDAGSLPKPLLIRR